MIRRPTPADLTDCQSNGENLRTYYIDSSLFSIYSERNFGANIYFSGEIMKEIIKTTGAPSAVGPYSQGIKISAGQMIFCAGQVALNPSDGTLVGVTAAEQTDQVLKNIRAILQAAGADMKNVVKTTIYLTDMNDFAAVNEVYGRYFTSEMPARATVQVSGLPKNGKVEIEAIAVI
ncbi:Protein DfrA (modular protein) [Candidatus Zixiibacteriota bacterium]|nr:Protein DfrA (modular protein) [candidate division Zixibacteria bacterium]